MNSQMIGVFSLILMLTACSSKQMYSENPPIPATKEVDQQASVRSFLSQYVKAWGQGKPELIASYLTPNLRKAWGKNTLSGLANQTTGQGQVIEIRDFIKDTEAQVFVQWNFKGQKSESPAWYILVKDSSKGWLIADVTRDFDPRSLQK